MKEMFKGWQEVGVNQPALVKKILSDYSGPFDVFRELIQNADDANAEKVEIHFLTENNEELKGAGVNVCKWIIRDNGDGLVSDDEWERLCMIANGNEDPYKVGTFGVGFYTVLGVCDQPLLRSMGQTLEMKMSREGRDDKLCAKRGPCKPDGWTTVELVLKKGLKERLPDLSDLARFLISSITFLEKVNTITVFLADRKPEVLCIQKNLESSSQSPVEIPAITNSRGIMAIRSINFATQLVSVHAAGKQFLAEPKTRPNKNTSRLSRFELSARAPSQMTASQARETKMEWKFEAAYCLYDAKIEAYPPREMEEGVKSTVKCLPRVFSCKAVYFSAKQQKVVEESSMRHLFDGLDGILPNNSGRIFIGQSTKEPTSIGLHIASKHIVPDVVRGAVRLGHGQVDEWNKSLLDTAGHLARAIYEQEMKIASKSDPTKLKELGLYTMQRFAFGRLPASKASVHLESGFFSAPKQSVLSSSGISDVSLVRQYDEDLHSVLKNIPYLHTELLLEQRELIEEKWKVSPIGSDDMEAEFASCRLSEAGMEGFFSWFEDAVSKGTLRAGEQTKKDFLEQLRLKGRLNCEECGVIKLKEIERYTQLTHHKELLPPNTIYIHQAQNCVKYLDLFGWKPLDPISWLRFVLDHADPNKAFDSRVLTTLAGPHGIPATSLQIWEQAADLLVSFECISTNHGLKKPCDSYLRVPAIWSDLPVANVDHLLTDHVYERLGVHSGLDLDGLLNRLEGSTAYTNDRFLPYLADMVAKKHLSDQQIEDLKRRKVFDSETHGKLAMTALHRPDKLGDILLELGLPILALRGMDGVSTDLLNRLAVRVYPRLDMIDEWLATSDNMKVNLAVRCLTENGVGYREEAKKPDVALIPTKSGALAHPNEVFSGSSWEELGFHIISGSLAEYATVLGVEKNPRPDRLIDRLKNEATSMEIQIAQTWFKQLSQCVDDFSVKQLEELEQVPFIPFARPHLLSTTHKCLKDCFAMSSLPELKPHLKDILPFIQFGDDGDNCLTTRTMRIGPPTASDIASAMVAYRQSFLQLANVEYYENDLRDIAKEFDSFGEELQVAMRTSPLLLGRRDGSYEEQLKQGCEILIGGDKENLSDFCQSIFVAPEGLKTLYEKLGSKPLDSCVLYQVYPTGADTTLSSPLSPEDIRLCADVFRDEEPAQERQFNISSCRLFVKTCRKLELVKRLDYSLGIVSENKLISPLREVAAGLRDDSDDSLTLWIVPDHGNMYTDVATALCRKLLKTYSRRDVLAMKLLLMDKESRVAQGISDKMKTVVQTTTQCGISGQRYSNPNNSSLATAATPVSSLIRRLVRKLLPEKGKGGAAVSKLDPIELMNRAINSAPREADLREESQKFRDSSTRVKRKSAHCRQIDTDLEEDERFKKHDIMFFRATKSQYPERLEEAVEKFAKLVIDLAGVFKMVPHVTFRIFWKDADRNLMAFNRKPGYIYLNLAHYYEHHHIKQVDKKRVIMDWYLIFAHEIAHNVSFQHDEVHETAFAGLCVSHLDALRRCFSYQPPLGSML